jgi:hypothetical protein
MFNRTSAFVFNLFSVPVPYRIVLVDVLSSGATAPAERGFADTPRKSRGREAEKEVA